MLEWIRGHCLSATEELRQEPPLLKDRRLLFSSLFAGIEEPTRLPPIASLLCVGVPVGKTGDESES